MATKKQKQSVKNTGIIPERKQKLRFYYLIIAIVSVIAYSNTLNHGYVLDDYSVIKENFVVKKGLEGIPTIFKTGYRFGYWNSPDNLYRPLPLAMFAIEWHFFPDNPAVGHFLNIVWYTLLCLLLFRVLTLIFYQYSVHLSFIAVLIFALHPIHTEVVANIKSRDEIMAFFFALLTIYFFIKYQEKSKLWMMVVALISLWLALLSKESAITFLAVIPLIFYFFKKTSWYQISFYVLMLMIPTLLFFAMRYNAIGTYAELDKTTMIDNLLVAAPDVFSRYATAIKILGLYLWKLIVPYPLACDYSYNQIPIVGITNIYFILSFIVYLALLWIAIRLFKKKHLLSFIIWFYLITMSINSNLFILIGTSFGERLLFVPSLAFALFVAFIIMKITKTPVDQPITVATTSKVITSKAFLLSFIVLIPYYVLTVHRNRDWQSSFSLYKADIKKSPNSAHMNYYYGLELMKQKAMENDQVVKPEYLDSAIFYFSKARKIIPTYADAFDQLGLAYFRKGDWDKALAYYDTCLTLAPGKPITYSNMGVIYFKRQQYDKALELYERVVRLDPKFADGWFNLGSTYGTLGRFQDAVFAFQKCLEFNPQKAEAYYFLGITYQNLNDKQNAEYYLNKAYELNPSLKK